MAVLAYLHMHMRNLRRNMHNLRRNLRWRPMPPPRNLHAHNCRGVVLSWACYGGHQHVNTRPNEYIVGIFRELGYRYDEETSAAMRRPAERETFLQIQRRNASRGHHGVYAWHWFVRSVMVFERHRWLTGSGCTARAEA